MDMHNKLTELMDFAYSRRNWVRGSVAAATGIAVGGSTSLGRAFAQDLTDMDILMLANTLEHLGTHMYRTITASNVLTGREQTYFSQFGDHEAAHAEALSAAIRQMGGTPPAPQEQYNTPPINNRGDALNFAKLFEETGIGAYQGAAAALRNKDLLAAAGSIVQTEARHVAIINLLIGIRPVPSAFTESLTVEQVLARANPILGQ
jgi:rubrerythrin